MPETQTPKAQTNNLDQKQIIQERKTVSRSAFKVGIGGLVSITAGFASQMIIAALFGAGSSMDAYLTALTIPLYLQGILLAGLSFVLIPAFVERIEAGQEDDAWALVGMFFWLVGGVLVAVSVAVSLFAAPIIRLMAPGFTSDKAALATTLLTVLAYAPVFSGYGVFTVSVENARGRFFAPAAAGALNSIMQIIIMLLLYRPLGILALAIGFVVAAAAQAMVTTVPVLRHGWSYRLSLRDARARQLLWLMAPFVLLGAFTAVTPILERYFASSLPDGDLSYLGYANKIARISRSLLGATIVTAIFPVMSRRFTRDGKWGLLTTFRYGMRLTLAVALPIVVIVSVLAVPVITLLFERGAFDHRSTLSVASVLPIFLIRGVLFLMTGNLLTRTFYVVKDTRTAPAVSVFSVFIYLGLAGWMTQRWGYMGLAATDMVRAGFGVVVLSALICWRYHWFPWRALLKYALVYGGPTMAAGGLAWMLLEFLGSSPTLMQLLVPGIAAGLFYFGLLHWLDAPIAADILEMTGISRVLRRVGVVPDLNRQRESTLQNSSGPITKLN